MRTGALSEQRQAVKSFLKLYFADEEEGRSRDLDAYLTKHPGHEDAIRAAWSRVRGESEVGTLDQIAQLRLVREIGRGGQGVVYLAEDTKLDRTVAVKLLQAPGNVWTDTMRTRFRREATVASRLQHPTICPIYEMDVHEGTPYIVMPHLEGTTLDAKIVSEPLDVTQACTWIESVARALHFAHEAGIVHRDVKPSNIMISEDGRPMLLDFGVAGDVEQLGALTMTGDLLGTLPFLSPEQVQGARADRRSDVYGLGVTLYECVTGKLPFDAPTQREVMNAIVACEPPDPRALNKSIPRDLAVVLETALEKDVERRFQSAAAFADELECIRERRPIRSRPAGPALRFRRWMRRNPRLAASVLGLFVVLAAGLVVSLSLLAKVDGERRSKEAALTEISKLTDLSRLEALQAEMVDFEPPTPIKAAAMKAWLERADALIARLPEQEALLEKLRESALVYSEEQRAIDHRRHSITPHYQPIVEAKAYLLEQVRGLDPERDAQTIAIRKQELEQIALVLPGMERKLRESRSWVMPSPEQQWRHDRQSMLVDAVRLFTTANRHGRTRARVAWLLTWSEKMQHETIDRFERSWARCIEQIADEERFPHYRGLRLATQLGLVPLGPDPESKLFEFAHWMSGKPPRRDRRTGRLRLRDFSGIVLVLLPGGRVRVGADAPGARAAGDAHVDSHARPHEQPSHFVELDPFFLSKFEITQRQWMFLTGKSPSEAFRGTDQGGQPLTTFAHPLEMVSWEEALATMARVGLLLPTSSQWEYAARAATTTVFFTGDEPESIEGYGNIADAAFARTRLRKGALLEVFDDGWPGHAPIGSFRPNAFGLHDMIGNVMEWTRDRHHHYKYHWLPGEALRPVGEGVRRALRGGSFLTVWTEARAAAFAALHQKASRNDVGFRPSRRLDSR